MHALDTFNAHPTPLIVSVLANFFRALLQSGVLYSARQDFMHDFLTPLFVLFTELLVFLHDFLQARFDLPFLPLQAALQFFLVDFATFLFALWSTLQTFLQSRSPLHAAREALISLATAFPLLAHPLIARAQDTGPACA